MTRSVVVSVVVADGEDSMLLRVQTAAKLSELFGADPEDDRLSVTEESTTLVVTYDSVDGLADVLQEPVTE